MSLTTAQLATLKTYINSVPSWASLPNDSTAALFIAGELNKPAAPAFVVWRRNIATAEIGPVLNYQAVAALTTANRDRATTFVALNPNSFNASADIASYWDTTFGGALDGQGAATRAALQSLWRRSASVAEKVLATGTGTDAAPAVLGFEGSIDYASVQAARSN